MEKKQRPVQHREQLRHQRGQERLECGIIGADVPAEELPVAAAAERFDDFRCELRSPLGHQVADSEPFDTETLPHFQIAFELFETEPVGAVGFHMYVEQLAGGSFTADFSVQRRRPQRHVKHVDAVGNRVVHKILHDPPMFFAPGRNPVVSAEAVGVEPFVAQQLLLRQRKGQHFQLDFGGCDFPCQSISENSSLTG